MRTQRLAPQRAPVAGRRRSSKPPTTAGHDTREGLKRPLQARGGLGIGSRFEANLLELQEEILLEQDVLLVLHAAAQDKPLSCTLAGAKISGDVDIARFIEPKSLVPTIPAQLALPGKTVGDLIDGNPGT